MMISRLDTLRICLLEQNPQTNCHENRIAERSDGFEHSDIFHHDMIPYVLKHDHDDNQSNKRHDEVAIKILLGC